MALFYSFADLFATWLHHRQWGFVLSALDLVYHRMLGPVLAAVTGHHRLRLKQHSLVILQFPGAGLLFLEVSGESVLALPSLYGPLSLRPLLIVPSPLPLTSCLPPPRTLWLPLGPRIPSLFKVLSASHLQSPFC